MVHTVQERTWKQTWLLGVFFLMASVIPVIIPFYYQNLFFSGHDLTFHLNRIQGLYESVKDGIYYPRINMWFLEGLGYGTGIFYNELVLYPVVVFRLLGFSLAQSYIMYVVLLNFCCFIFSYETHRRISENCEKALVFSVLYTLSLYRIGNIIIRAAIGEFAALTFMPIVFSGLFNIFYRSPQKWWHLSIGMALVMYSHMLSGVMTAVFVFIVFMVNIWHLDKEKIKALVKATLFTLPFVASLLLPILEQMLSVEFQVGQDKWTFMYENSVNPLRIAYYAIFNTGHRNIGLVLFLGICGLPFFYRRFSQEDKSLTWVVVVLCFMVSFFFPWILFKNTFLDVLQFPWRLLGIISLLIAWLVTDNLGIFKVGTRKKRMALIAISVFLVVWANLNAIRKEPERRVERTFLENDFSHDIGANEYLVRGTQLGNIHEHATTIVSDSRIYSSSEFEKKQNLVVFSKESEGTERFIVPLLWYKGYDAEVEGTGKILTLQRDTDSGLVSLVVEGRGTVSVWYAGTVVQKIGNIVSLVAWLSFGCLGIFTTFHRKEQSPSQYFVESDEG